MAAPGTLPSRTCWWSSFVVLVATPLVPAAGGDAILQHIAAHRSVHCLQQALWLAPNVLLGITFPALRPVPKT
ncbi:MAG TPA: hypothetical protein VFD01_19345 [Candidatus Dormibacteraeota bacterium]|nr:hypothetical protein [Candidatus Dormibacteraeota bacterium]